MPRVMLRSLSKSRQNLEIVEIRQVHRGYIFLSRSGRKVFLGDDISDGAYFSLFQKYVLKLVSLRVFD